MKLESPISLWSKHELLGSVKTLDQEEILDETHFYRAEVDFAYRHGGDGLRSILDLAPVQKRLSSGNWLVSSSLQKIEAGHERFPEGGHLDSTDLQDTREKIVASFGRVGTDYAREDRETSELSVVGRWIVIPNGVVVAHRMNRDVHRMGGLIPGWRSLITIIGPGKRIIRPSNKISEQPISFC